MRVLLQRVLDSWVDIEGNPTEKTGLGLAALVGFQQGDGRELLDTMASKLVRLRVFDDGAGLMNRSLLDVGGELLLVSQFTLYADCRKGRRPGFSRALRPEAAAELFRQFGDVCRKITPKVIMGKFGANMQVHLINDGPVTIMLDSGELMPAGKVGNSKGGNGKGDSR